MGKELEEMRSVSTVPNGEQDFKEIFRELREENQ
jgi:hypothetical protein